MNAWFNLRACSAALVCVCLLLSPGVEAQTDPATARILFEQGRKLASEGNYPAACPVFEESYRLDPGIGTLFNLADCWEHIGRTASAWARFLDVAEGARRAGQLDREKIARARAAALEPKLSRLVVRVDARDPGLELAKDGKPFGTAQWGSALPIDPGTHTVEARAPNRQPWKTTFQVAADGGTVTVVVPALAGPTLPTAPPATAAAPATAAPRPTAAPPATAAPWPTAPPPATAAPAPASSAPRPPAAPVSSLAAPATTNPSASPAYRPPEDSGAERPTPGRGQRIAGWVVGGVGILGIVVGVVAGVDVLDKNKEADAVCPTSKNCSRVTDQPRYEQAIQDAKDARAAAITGFVLGGAALTTGVILLLTAPSSSATGLGIAPSVGVGHLGATLTGGF